MPVMPGIFCYLVTAQARGLLECFFVVWRRVAPPNNKKTLQIPPRLSSYQPRYLIKTRRRHFMDRYRIKPGQKVDLDDFDPDDRSAWKDSKEAALEKLAGLRLELDHLQEILYAEHTHKILVVLQAMDTAGKDGTIRSVFEGVNPQGVHVASFK